MRSFVRTLPFIFRKNTCSPPYLIHFVTNRCNAGCGHCFINAGNKRYKGEELTLEEIEKFTRNLNKKLVHVNLTGGEIFLRDDIPEIAACYSKNAGVGSLALLTNGYFTEKIVNDVNKILNENPSLFLIAGISLDEINDKHDGLRNCEGLFGRAAGTVKRLKEIDSGRFSIHVNLTVMDGNSRNICEIYDKIIGLFGGININCTLVRNKGEKEEVVKNYENLVEKKLRHARVYGTGSSSFFGVSIINLRNRYMNNETAAILRGAGYKSPCVAGRLAFVLHANGEVYPCEDLDAPLGNIRDNNYSMADIIKKPEAKKCVEMIKKTNCSCAHGCFLGMTVLYSPGYYPSLLKQLLKEGV